MYQIYFLSVLLNALSGLVLSSEFLDEKFASFSGIREILDNSGVKFIIGISTFIVGLLKFFFPVTGEWLILGDFLPAFGGCLLGFALLLDYLKERSVVNTDTLIRLDSLVTSNKTAIGFAGIGIAILHFFFCNGFFL